jgi:hypothetical protein
LLIIGLPNRVALPVFMPLLTFWVWYISMRPHMKTIYGAKTAGTRLSFTYDRVALGGTAVYLIALMIISKNHSQ